MIKIYNFDETQNLFYDFDDDGGDGDNYFSDLFLSIIMKLKIVDKNMICVELNDNDYYLINTINCEYYHFQL